MTIQIIIMLAIFSIGGMIAWIGDYFGCKGVTEFGTIICCFAFIYFLVAALFIYKKNVRNKK